MQGTQVERDVHSPTVPSEASYHYIPSPDLSGLSHVAPSKYASAEDRNDQKNPLGGGPGGGGGE